MRKQPILRVTVRLNVSGSGILRLAIRTPGRSSQMQYWVDYITGTHESSFWKRQVGLDPEGWQRPRPAAMTVPMKFKRCHGAPDMLHYAVAAAKITLLPIVSTQILLTLPGHFNFLTTRRHQRGCYRAAITLAESICRAPHRLDPPRMFGSHYHL